VYSGKSNILLTHCGLLFNPPPSPLKFTYISFKQPVACHTTLMWALHNQQNNFCNITTDDSNLYYQATALNENCSRMWRYKMFFLIKHVMEYANIHLTGVTQSQISFTNFKTCRCQKKSNTMTRESGHGTMALNVLTSHTHFTPQTSCDENEQGKQQKKNMIFCTKTTSWPQVSH